MFDVLFYELENGRRPVEKFLNSLSEKSRAKTFVLLDQLAKFGNKIGEPESKYMGDGIFELRLRTVDGQVRVFYFFCHDRRCVLTNGFLKKDKKTPRKYLNLARKYKTDYEMRFK